MDGTIRAGALLGTVDERLREALAELERTRLEAERVGTELLALRHTVTAKDRGVAITVDAQGVITDVRFPVARYRDLAPAELSAGLMRTYGEARAAVAVLAEEIVRPVREQAERTRRESDPDGTWSGLLFGRPVPDPVDPGE